MPDFPPPGGIRGTEGQELAIGCGCESWERKRAGCGWERGEGKGGVEVGEGAGEEAGGGEGVGGGEVGG